MNADPFTTPSCRPSYSGSRELGRQGFTLMELLLALMLCGMVLSAAFGAVHLSWKYRSAGETQVEQSQVIRGVLQDISLDLRSAVVPPEPQDTEEQLSEIANLPDHIAAAFKTLVRKESPQFTNPNRIEERVLEFDSIEKIDPIHFYGERDFFVAFSDSPNYRFTNLTSQGSASSPLSHTVWWWNSGRAIRVPFSIQNDRLQRRTLTGNAAYNGLIRVQQGFDVRSVKSTAGGRAGAIVPSDGHWMSIVPDVSEVSFRYSDGVTWQASWNSHSTRTLPAAVEFILARKQDPVEHRFVIRLPQVSNDLSAQTDGRTGAASR